MKPLLRSEWFFRQPFRYAPERRTTGKLRFAHKPEETGIGGLACCTDLVGFMEAWSSSIDAMVCASDHRQKTVVRYGIMAGQRRENPIVEWKYINVDRARGVAILSLSRR